MPLGTKRRVLSAAGLALGLALLCGCENSFAGFVPIDPIGSDYDGIWLTECRRDWAGRNQGATFVRVYDAERFISHIRLYSTAGCVANSELATVTVTGTFEVGAEIMGNVDDARGLDLTVETMELALHTYDALFEAMDLGTGDLWALGKPVDIRSHLGDVCELDDDCPHAICDLDTWVCTRRTSAGTNAWRDLLALYDLPELRAGDLLYDIITLDRVTDEETGLTRAEMLSGDLDLRWATFPYQRPIASSQLPYARRAESAALDVALAEWYHGTWVLAAEPPAPEARLIIDASTVEVSSPTLAGTYEVLAPLFSLEPNVFELREISDSGGDLYTVRFLYLGFGIDGLLATIGASSRTASDDPAGPFIKEP